MYEVSNAHTLLERMFYRGSECTGSTSSWISSISVTQDTFILDVWVGASASVAQYLRRRNREPMKALKLGVHPREMKQDIALSFVLDVRTGYIHSWCLKLSNLMVLQNNSWEFTWGPRSTWPKSRRCQMPDFLLQVSRYEVFNTHALLERMF